ncbi:cytochrome P450 [Kitasatospora sp. NPDC058444]|uniref:cytochrome P450 n=1 Tax=Kitasatospora sp. NPDC058444 TaxID=3346504 RepID=UPI00364ACED6
MSIETSAYHPLDPAVHADPYPAYAAMRRTGGPCWNERLNGWLVTSYRDCRQVLRDHETFAADWRRAGESMPDSALSIHHLDPPEHSVVAGLIASTLRPLSSPEFAARVRVTVDELLDSLPPGPVDLIGSFTVPLSRWFVPSAMGLPEFEPEVMEPIAAAIMRAMDAGLVPEAGKPGAAARQKLTGMLKSWIDDMEPGAPLRNLLDDARRAGLPELMTINSLRTLVVNAFSSVPGSLGNSLYALARHRIPLKEHLGTPGVLDDTAPQELFRYDTPLQATTRLCVTDTTLSGADIRRGQDVVVFFGAANRDPERFPEPDRIMLDRTPNGHLAFGYGAHACAGSMLSKLLLGEVLQALARRGASLRLADEVTRHPYATIRSLAALPVEISG